VWVATATPDGATTYQSARGTYPGAQGQLSETHFTTRSYDDRHVRRRRRQRRRRRRRRPFPTIQTLLPSRSNTVTVARAAFRSHASHVLGSTPSPRTARTRPLHRPHGYIHASRESVNSRPIAMAEEYLYGKYERPWCHVRCGFAISRRTRILTYRRPFKREGDVLAGDAGWAFGHCDTADSWLPLQSPEPACSVTGRCHSLATNTTLVSSVFRNHPRGTECKRGMGPGAQEWWFGRRGPRHRRWSEAHYKNGECATFRQPTEWQQRRRHRSMSNEFFPAYGSPLCLHELASFGRFPSFVVGRAVSIALIGYRFFYHAACFRIPHFQLLFS